MADLDVPSMLLRIETLSREADALWANYVAESDPGMKAMWFTRASSKTSEKDAYSRLIQGGAAAHPTQGKPTPRPRLRHSSIFARSPLAPCSFYLAPPVSLPPPCSVLSNLLCASGRRVCARTRLRDWESEIAGHDRELSLWHVRVSVSVCV